MHYRRITKQVVSASSQQIKLWYLFILHSYFGTLHSQLNRGWILYFVCKCHINLNPIPLTLLLLVIFSSLSHWVRDKWDKNVQWNKNSQWGWRTSSVRRWKRAASCDTSRFDSSSWRSVATDTERCSQCGIVRRNPDLGTCVGRRRVCHRLSCRSRRILARGGGSRRKRVSLASATK